MNDITTLFITLRFLDVIDIIMVAALLYLIYNFIKGTVAINIIMTIGLIYLLWKLVEAYEMEMLSQILGQFMSVGVLALIIVFQQEVRQFLLMIGKNSFFKKGKRMFDVWTRQMGDNKNIFINNIVKACDNLAKSNTGALIVITKKNALQNHVETGHIINARISDLLIENIFFKNSPLHDGAIIISDQQIVAARCILPLTERKNIPTHMGLRHRAGIGVTEESDAIAIVVSEQTGNIAYCREGVLQRSVTPNKLRDLLSKEAAMA